jgi:Uma2 family endonuclease
MAKVLDKPRMTVDQFLRWAMAQSDGPRYELVAGEVVAMAPERAVHARRKVRIWRALSDAIGGQACPVRRCPTA